MGMKAGLWIDHRKAVVVVVTGEGEVIRQIESHAEKQLRRAGSMPLQGNYESQQVPADDSRQRTFTGQLNSYYDEVITSIRNAESILIFGPGVAKNQLKERLEVNHLAGLVAAVETVDKMTDPQIAAKVRLYFAKVKI